MLRFSKAFVALGTAGLIALQTVLTHGTGGVDAWITVTLAVLGAATVYAVRNTPPDDDSLPDWAAGRGGGQHHLRTPDDV